MRIRIYVVRRIMIGVTILALVLWLSRHLWLPKLYDFLDVGQPPEQADFIVVLGGGADGNRAILAAELYRQGLAPRLIASGCYPAILSDMEELIQAGVPSEVIISNVHAESTWNEAKQVLTLLKQENATSALIVTDGFHTRRARATYDHLQTDPEIRLTFVSTSGPFVADSWWQIPSGPRLVLGEYVKLAYYLVRYGVIP